MPTEGQAHEASRLLSDLCADEGISIAQAQIAFLALLIYEWVPDEDAQGKLQLQLRSLAQNVLPKEEFARLGPSMIKRVGELTRSAVSYVSTRGDQT